MTTYYATEAHKKFYATLDSETLKAMELKLDELASEAVNELNSIIDRRSLVRRELNKKEGIIS